MRLIHTADWHLGRILHGVHLTEDQAYVLDQLVDLVDRTGGRTVLDEEHVERAGFSSSRGESPDSARREVFDRLARWVTSRLESDW